MWHDVTVGNVTFGMSGLLEGALHVACHDSGKCEHVRCLEYWKGTLHVALCGSRKCEHVGCHDYWK